MTIFGWVLVATFTLSLLANCILVALLKKEARGKYIFQAAVGAAYIVGIPLWGTGTGL